MILRLVSLAAGPYKIPAMIGAAMFIVSSFFVWLKVHDYNIRQEVIAEFNEQQEKILAEKKAEYEANLQKISQEADRLRAETSAKNQKIEQLTTEIEKDISSKDADDKAPDYLRQVIDKMNKNFGEKR